MTETSPPTPPRRGVLPGRSLRFVPAVPGQMVLRVWLLLTYLGVAGWLITGGRGLTQPLWTEGMIAPHPVYAPATLSFSMESAGAGGTPTITAVTIQRDELVISKGQRVSAEQAMALRALAAQSAASRTSGGAWGLWLLTAVVVVAGCAILAIVAPATAAQTPHMVLIGLLSLAALAVSLLARVAAGLPAWGIPLAAMSMPVTLLLGPVPALVATLVTGLAIGLAAGPDLAVALSVILGGVAGVVAVRGARRRGDLLRAGAWSGAAQGVAMVAAHLAQHDGAQAAFWGGVTGGAVSGGLAFAVTIVLLPILEHCFGLITDITLLELSDLNHPLLKELSLKAPGTYHHSLLVATLAEAACEAIGANGLLARVGCYFHDVGKIPKAEYFVENQGGGPSQHDRLAPSLSSLIIINHVKEGIELARHYHLSPAIIEFIPGHHGTGLIYYFYRRALEQVEDEQLLKEENFRYPGPRPHRRETAVALLADSVEAACRALPAHTPAKLQGAVRRIINNKFIDGQLNDCELSLRDLEQIAEAFVRVMSGMYHSRVPYPVPPGEDVEEEGLDLGPAPRSAADPGPSPPPPAAGAGGPAAS